jgi:rhodanese-related sulfurtransferase
VTVQEISVQDLAALGDSARVIDVREPDEWAQGHIAHATLVPLATVPGNIEEFDGDPTYIVCRSGARSGRACEFLGEQGRNVVNVAGGMIAWTAAGLDVATGAGPGSAGG